jgi:hypothetical protein
MKLIVTKFSKIEGHTIVVLDALLLFMLVNIIFTASGAVTREQWNIDIKDSHASTITNDGKSVVIFPDSIYKGPPLAVQTS